LIILSLHAHPALRICFYTFAWNTNGALICHCIWSLHSALGITFNIARSLAGVSCLWWKFHSQRKRAIFLIGVYSSNPESESVDPVCFILIRNLMFGWHFHHLLRTMPRNISNKHIQ
jgi:hypothetical protein